MLKFIIQRLFSLIPVALGVVTVVALLIHIVPGDPIDTMLGPYATATEKNEMREKIGLNLPVPTQIANYFAKLFRADLGESLVYQKPVLDLIKERMGPTFELALCAMLFASLLSLPLGIVSALKAGSKVDFAAMGFALFGIAVPNFWLGPMLVLFFALKLGLLPVSERSDLSSYVLPAITLGLPLAAILSRMTRNSMLDHLREDYVRTARAKGLSPRVVHLKHVLRNAALPLVTVVGLQFGALLTGAIITERIYDWPGMGSLILEGINNRDYPVVQGLVLTFSFTYLLVNLLTDLAYAAIDPRIKLSR